MTGTVKISGYLRGKTLSVNQIIHIPGFGDFQLAQIDTASDPHPLNKTRSKGDVEMFDDDATVFETPDPEVQESLKAINDVSIYLYFIKIISFLFSKKTAPTL